MTSNSSSDLIRLVIDKIHETQRRIRGPLSHTAALRMNDQTLRELAKGDDVAQAGYVATRLSGPPQVCGLPVQIDSTLADHEVEVVDRPTEPELQTWYRDNPELRELAQTVPALGSCVLSGLSAEQTVIQLAKHAKELMDLLIDYRLKRGFDGVR